MRVHPETSERSLVRGGFARTVLGFTPSASRDLIRLLQEQHPSAEQTARAQRQGDPATGTTATTQH